MTLDQNFMVLKRASIGDGRFTKHKYFLEQKTLIVYSMETQSLQKLNKALKYRLKSYVHWVMLK